MMNEFYDVGMVEMLKDLQLSIFVPFILENLFDSNSLLVFVDFGLQNEENRLTL